MFTSYQQHQVDLGGTAQVHHLQSNNTVLANQQFSPLPSPHAAEFDHYVQHQSPHHFTAPGGTPDSEIMGSDSTSSGGSTFSPCHQASHHSQQQPQLGSPWYQTVSSPNSSAGVNGLGHTVAPGFNPYFPVSPAVNGSPHSIHQQNGYEIL